MLKEFLNNSYLFGGNAPFIEELYEKYLANPQSVPEEWRDYFDRMQVLPGSNDKDVAHAPVVESFVQQIGRASCRERVYILVGYEYFIIKHRCITEEIVHAHQRVGLV